MVTIRDVAKEVNLSVTTVSRVLNNKPDVSEKTKQRVIEAIDKLGYQPNGVARSLVLQKTNTIGLIIPDISNPFFPAMVKGIERTAKERGYSIVLYNTDNDQDEEKAAISLFRSKQFDGIILTPSSDNKYLLKRLEKTGYPIVQVDRTIEGSTYPSVTIDNTRSAYVATEYLIQKGHRDIGHITGYLGSETAINRLNGFKQALLNHGLSYREDWVMEGDYSKSTGKRLMEQIIGMKSRPTALFFANDLMALGAYESILEQGYQIPEDFSIVGHDNIDITSLIKPGLTTMDQPKYRLGEIAAEKLIASIERKTDEISQCVLLENNIVIRDSVRKVRR